MKITSKIFSMKLVLVLLLLVIVVATVPASAMDTPLFSIPGKTTVLFPNGGISTMSTVDYGPLNIPPYLIEKDSFSGAKYTLLSFENPFSVRSETVQVPIVLYGTEYLITLHKEYHSFLPVGKDFYSGTIPGKTDSEIVLFVSEPNVITGTVYMDGEYLEIKPVQNKNYGERTQFPLHIAYSTKDFPEGTVVTFVDKHDDAFVSPELVYNSSDLTMMSTLADANTPVRINILLATDSVYDAQTYDWSREGYRLVRELEASYANGGLPITFFVSFDYSQMNALSSHNSRITDPLAAAKSIFTDSYLNGKGADLAIYLGGYDQYDASMGTSNGNWQGQAGFPWNTARVGWVQMVDDTNPSTGSTYNPATQHARTYCFIHEMGHLLGAIHPNTGDHWTTYLVTQNGPYYVMWSMYQKNNPNSDFPSLDYGSKSVSEILSYYISVSNYV